MADYKANIQKYTSSIDEAALTGMSKTYALVMSKRDSSLVSATDPEEKARVRENFLKKKLGLKNSDADLDAAIEGVMNKMKEDKMKSRMTVYYLLAEQFKMLGMFHPKK